MPQKIMVVESVSGNSWTDMYWTDISAISRLDLKRLLKPFGSKSLNGHHKSSCLCHWLDRVYTTMVGLIY